ncbi:hypothetical protein FRX31_016717 [Thalictrum thalictroides]|uniref:F-box protein n=1 Tax=Thalictrum thalictroides TaxID=46969 RepID=A0A7J6W9U0_THATH|nr:hypothetical protein FRX31_016717 [Thalictrum thalictroides]
MENQSFKRSVVRRSNNLTSSRDILRFLQATHQQDLPHEVMQYIFSMLPMAYVFLYKFVCQGWRKSICEPEMARLHFLHSRDNPRTTSLLLYSVVRSKSSGVEDISLRIIPYADKCDHAFELTNLQFIKSFLPKFKIMGSCHGLVCVADDSCTYSKIRIFNPVTGHCYLCPESNLGRQGKVINGKFFGFGYDPNLKLYKVVRIREVVSGGRMVGMAIELHILGTGCWETYKFPKKYMMLSGPRGRTHGVFFRGVFLWLCITENSSVMYIGAFYTEMGEEHLFRAFELPQPIIGRNCYQVYFGELDGIFSVAYDGNPSEKYMDVWQLQENGHWLIGYKIPKPDPCSLCKSIARVQPLGIDMNGNILFNVRCCVHRGFYSYNPKNDTLLEFRTNGLPTCYAAFPLTPTFFPLKEAIYCSVMEEIHKRDHRRITACNQ